MEIPGIVALALPVATTALMFAYKWIARLKVFHNGAAARPWLRTLLIGTSLIGVFGFSLLTGTEPNEQVVSGLIEVLLGIVGTAANALFAHLFYKWMAQS